MRGWKTIALATGICLAAPAAAQAPRFHAPEDTVHYRSVNPYLLYWISGKDTVGTPAHGLSVESRAWSEDGTGLDVRVSERSLDPNRTEQRHHFRLTPQGATVLAQARVFDTTSWTAPTLVGTTLYARDREKIVALDMGKP